MCKSCPTPSIELITQKAANPANWRIIPHGPHPSEKPSTKKAAPALCSVGVSR